MIEWKNQLTLGCKEIWINRWITLKREWKAENKRKGKNNRHNNHLMIPQGIILLNFTIIYRMLNKSFMINPISSRIPHKNNRMIIRMKTKFCCSMPVTSMRTTKIL
jgi:hypothetical protein